MSPRRKKDQPPMKYRGFYCPDDLWAEMQRCAEIADESDSEYIRKAIAMQNKQYNRCGMMMDSTHKNNTIPPIPEYASFAKNNTASDLPDIDFQKVYPNMNKILTDKVKNNTESNQSICESIQKSINEDVHNGKYEGIKPYQPKSSMVNPLPKGGGKK